MAKEALGNYNNTVEQCFSWMNEDGSYQCHWGPEEYYDCWQEGYDYVSKLERCQCTANDAALTPTC